MTERSIITDIIILIIGVVIGHVWNRVVNRLSVLRYVVWHQYIGLSAEDPRFGSVKIIYNEVPVKSLYISTAVVTNDSNRDLSQLELNVACDQSSAIIISYAANKSSLDHLNFTDKYSDLLNENKPEMAGYLGNRRDYFVPVLNRTEIIEISMLVTNFNAVQPNITVACSHPGVKIKFQKVPPQKIFGESQQFTAFIGLLVSAALCYSIIQYNFPLSQAVWYSFVLGGAATLIGVLVIKLFKFIRRFLT